MSKASQDAQDFVSSKGKALPKFTQDQSDFVAYVLKYNAANPTDKRSIISVHSRLKEKWEFKYGVKMLSKMVCAEFGRKTWAKK